jgi:hypothetical protein
MENEYYKELQLSRKLANAIQEEINSFGKVVPNSVYNAFIELKQHYEKQQESGIQ